jgi:hypothetical protein
MAKYEPRAMVPERLLAAFSMPPALMTGAFAAAPAACVRVKVAPLTVMLALRDCELVLASPLYDRLAPAVPVDAEVRWNQLPAGLTAAVQGQPAGVVSRTLSLPPSAEIALAGGLSE